MARERRTAAKAAEVETPETQEAEKPSPPAIPEKSKIEQAREIYESLIAKPEEINIGGEKYLVSPKSTLHLSMIVERLAKSSENFDALMKILSQITSPESQNIEAMKELILSFGQLFDLLVGVFALVLCPPGVPDAEELQKIEEHLDAHLSVPLAMFLLTCVMEQNSFRPFMTLLQGTVEEIRS